jgi:alkanesulfonate monooxygenase SsuD/methylene tetrahydromethanopterin reductase-like flavin-dependent oxidoreductase (luciferase family)
MLKRLSQIPVSLLDPVEIRANDAHIADAFQRKGRLVQVAATLGYNRYWFMHHPPAADQGATAAILLAHLAGSGSGIRIGTDLLIRSSPNASAAATPYALLDSLYPGRLEGILTGVTSGWQSDAFPPTIPFWMMGTDLQSAELAGTLGLPFAFASHFAPARLMDALELYRTSFKPSVFLSKPYTLACVHAIVATSDEEAEYLASSLYQMVLGLLRKTSEPLPAPKSDLNVMGTDNEWINVRRMLWYSFFGDAPSVKQSLQSFVDQTDVDEVMICSVIFDERNEWASLRAIAELFRKTPY